MLPALLMLIAVSAFPASGAARIVTAPRAQPLELYAARELAHFLGRLYPGESFETASAAPARDPYIQLGRRGACASVSVSGGPDSYTVKVVKRGARRVACITGRGPRGTLYGVYGLLEKLGFGFYLSYTAEPAPRTGSFQFTGWQLQDAPLFAERFLFNWHNFLSSASTWNFPDWQRYIDQTVRLRYGGIMVHAYGNNPIFVFRHNGVEKPVGFLSTTRSGRDWGTQHVNDVRRLYGAAGIFDKPVFGADAAMAPDNERAASATKLMQRVFDYAESRGLAISFALDVDTAAANPRQIIRTLPRSSRFRSGGLWLPIPDSPGGQAYYASLFRQLVETYPQIDQVVVWYRRARTPLMSLTPDSLPACWRQEFAAEIARHVGLKGDPYSAPMFALGRILVRARNTLDAAGRGDIELATGTWDFASLPAANSLFPDGVNLMVLDSSIQFDTAKVQNIIRSLSRHRQITPILWAHHDDHTYIGRPYTPFPHLASTLREDGAYGVGIIHWTTRPLDLYFTSTIRQLWRSSKDEPLEVTCRRVARATFSRKAAGKAAAYLSKWIREAPMFGRETTDRFIDRPLGDTHRVVRLSRSRRAILESIGKDDLTVSGRHRWAYFRHYERFIEQFFLAQNTLERSVAALKRGEGTEAAADILTPPAGAGPEEAIEQYALAARQGSITRGEMALLVSLNLRWLPYFRAQRQVLGLEPVRVNFQPTRHDPLAQGAGHNTFFFDTDRNIWSSLGEKETGLPAWEEPGFQRAPSGFDPGLFLSGIDIRHPVTLPISAVTGAKLPSGEYKIELWFLDESSTPKHVIRAGQTARAEDGAIAVKLRPFHRQAKLCALVITRHSFSAPRANR